MSGTNATAVYSIHDILTVRSNTDIPVPDWFRVSASSTSHPDIVVEKGPVDPGIDRSEMTRSGMFFFGTSGDSLVIDYMLPIVDVTLVIEDLAGETTIRYTSSYERFGSVGVLFNTVLQFKLIQRGYTFVHAGSVRSGQSGTLLVGMRNTGKTSVVLSLVDGTETEYLSDDLTIVDRSGTAYCYPTPVEISPFTLTGDLMTYTGSTLQRWLARRQILSLLAQEFIGYELSEQKRVPEHAIGATSPITEIAILGENGSERVKKLSTEKAVNRLLMSTTELLDPFRIYSINFFSFYLDFDTADLFAKEREIIAEALDSAECYEVHAPSVEGYSNLLQ